MVHQWVRAQPTVASLIEASFTVDDVDAIVTVVVGAAFVVIVESPNCIRVGIGILRGQVRVHEHTILGNQRSKPQTSFMRCHVQKGAFVHNDGHFAPVCQIGWRIHGHN